MTISYCNACGAEVIKVVSSYSTGPLKEIDPKFCRVCGNAFFEALYQEDFDADLIQELPSWRELGEFDQLEEVIAAAVPKNFSELTLKQLRKHIVRWLWKRYTGIDIFISPEVRMAIEREREEVLQRCLETGAPPPILLPEPKSYWDEALWDSVKEYHVVWINGLRTHLTLTPEEAEGIRPELARSYYTIEPCDCVMITFTTLENKPRKTS
jgi:hypothetical protein